jgi:endonuclease I
VLLAHAALLAEPPLGYYDSAQGKSGSELRSALHGIVRNQHPLVYSGSPYPNTADALGTLDEDPANTNNVLGIYSGYSIPKTNIGSASGTWNREHLWPQSYGTGDGPARTDLHHMRPEQANVNSSRGNNYYDWSDGRCQEAHCLVSRLCRGLAVVQPPEGVARNRETSSPGEESAQPNIAAGVRVEGSSAPVRARTAGTA